MVCWFISIYCYWQCLTWCYTFKFVCYIVFISCKFPFSNELYICFIYLFIFSIVALEYPFSIIFCIYILSSCRLSRIYISFICITVLVCWFIAFYYCWQCLIWRSTFKFVCYTVFISCKFPFSNELYICFVYLFIFSIITLKYPFTIIFCIYIL